MTEQHRALSHVTLFGFLVSLAIYTSSKPVPEQAVPVPVPGAELEAECSTGSCVPSMFSLFSACFFSVLVLEGSMGNRGK